MPRKDISKKREIVKIDRTESESMDAQLKAYGLYEEGLNPNDKLQLLQCLDDSKKSAEEEAQKRQLLEESAACDSSPKKDTDSEPVVIMYESPCKPVVTDVIPDFQSLPSTSKIPQITHCMSNQSATTKDFADEDDFINSVCINQKETEKKGSPEIDEQDSSNSVEIHNKKTSVEDPCHNTDVVLQPSSNGKPTQELSDELITRKLSPDKSSIFSEDEIFETNRSMRKCYISKFNKSIPKIAKRKGINVFDPNEKERIPLKPKDFNCSEIESLAFLRAPNECPKTCFQRILSQISNWHCELIHYQSTLQSYVKWAPPLVVDRRIKSRLSYLRSTLQNSGQSEICLSKKSAHVEMSDSETSISGYSESDKEWNQRGTGNKRRKRKRGTATKAQISIIDENNEQSAEESESMSLSNKFYSHDGASEKQNLITDSSQVGQQDCSKDSATCKSAKRKSFQLPSSTSIIPIVSNENICTKETAEILETLEERTVQGNGSVKRNLVNPEKSDSTLSKKKKQTYSDSLKNPKSYDNTQPMTNMENDIVVYPPAGKFSRKYRKGNYRESKMDPLFFTGDEDSQGNDLYEELPDPTKSADDTKTYNGNSKNGINWMDDSDSVECPLCLKKFAISAIEEHASGCQVSEKKEQSDEVVFLGRPATRRGIRSRNR